LIGNGGNGRHGHAQSMLVVFPGRPDIFVPRSYCLLIENGCSRTGPDMV
jgi:hypothetical protein